MRADERFPYPAPLPAQVRDGHARAARRLYWWFGASILVLQLPGFVMFLVSEHLPRLRMAGVVILTLGVVTAVVLWRKGVCRHRAVLAAYGIASGDDGTPVRCGGRIVEDSRRGREIARARRRRREAAGREARTVSGLDLRTEAAGALRLHWAVSAVGVVMVAGFAVLTAFEVDAFDPRAQWVSTPVQVAFAAALFVGGGAGLHLLRRKMRRVALAGGPADPRGRYGPVVLATLLVLGATAGWAVEAVAVAPEPAVSVEARVECEGSGRRVQCKGRWEYAGRAYSGGGLPISKAHSGETVQIEVFAARPDLVKSGWDRWDLRYGVWVNAAVLVVLAGWWLRRSVALTRTLRNLARTSE